jgi:outer membrane protein assembly factor BamB
MNGGPNRETERLLAFWDALQEGGVHLPDLDPGLAKTVRYLHQNDPSEAVRPEFAAGLRDRLFAGQMSETEGSAVLQAVPYPVPALPVSIERQSSPSGRRTWGWRAAALLVACLGVVALVAGQDRLSDLLTADTPAIPTSTVASIDAPTPSPEPQISVDGMPMYMGNAARTGLADAAGPGDSAAIAWTAQMDKGSAGTPALADGIIYLGSADGHLYAFDAESGKELWAFQGAGPMRTSALIAGDIVVTTAGFAGMDGAVHGVDRVTGEERWSFAVDNQVQSDPLFYDGLVIFGCDDGVVYALNPESGELAWSYQAGGPVSAAAAAGGGQVVFGSGEGVLTAIDAATGTEQWTSSPPSELTGDPGDPNPGHSWSTPLILDRTVFVTYSIATQMAVTPQLVLAVDLETGALQWARDDLLGLRTSLLMPAPDGTIRALSMGSNEALLTTFESGSGNPVGERLVLPETENVSAAGGAIGGDRLYILDGGGNGEGSARLRIFDLADASQVAEVPLPGPGDIGQVDGRRRPPLVIDGSVYVGKNDGTVVAIRDQ